MYVSPIREPLIKGENFFVAGHIFSIHGIKGYFKMISYTEPLENIFGSA